MIACIMFLILLWLPPAGTVVPVGAIQEAVEKYVHDQRDHSQGTAIVEFRSLPGAVSIAGSTYDVRVCNERTTEVKGNVSLPIEIVSERGVERRLIVSIKVRTFQAVLIASKQLLRHATMSNELAELKTVETTSLPADIISDPRPLLGMRTKKIIPAGSVLRECMLEAIPLIHAGDSVTMLVKSGNVTISTGAIAEEDGRWNEQVKIRKVGTRVAVKGRVVGAGIVQLDPQ
jgi:flagella basal body P-ring formation protein FlgA